MSFQKKVKALEKAQKLDKGGPTCQLAMQKVCQKKFFYFKSRFFDEIVMKRFKQMSNSKKSITLLILVTQQSFLPI